MNTITLLAIALLVFSTLCWTNITVPFPTQTYPITKTGVKSVDMSAWEIVFLKDDGVIQIHNLQTQTQTTVDTFQTATDMRLKVYFENQAAVFFQIILDGTLYVYRIDGSSEYFSDDVDFMVISDNCGFFTMGNQLHSIKYPSLSTDFITLSDQPVLDLFPSGNGFVTVQTGTKCFLYDSNLNLIKEVLFDGNIFLPSLSLVVKYSRGQWGSAMGMKAHQISDDTEILSRNTGGVFYQTFACASMIVLIQERKNDFINVTSSSSVVIQTEAATSYVTQIGGKCYENDFKIALLNINSANTDMYEVKVYTFAVDVDDNTNPTNPTNPTDPTNPTTPTNPVTESKTLTPREKKIDEFNKAVLDVLISEKFRSISQNSASATGVLASNPLTRQGIKPLFNFFEDLWFYGFHPIMYPDFIEAFTTQVDILNVLKIKPTFLDFELEAEWLSQNNQVYKQSIQEQINSPDTVFMLESIKDIYSVNLPMSVIQFFIFLMIKKISQKIRAKLKIFAYVYHFLKNECLWFTLIISVFQSSIVSISFYGGIQFNHFYNLDFTSKVNCLFTLFIVLVVIIFSFSFFALLQKYSKPSTSRELLDFSEYVSSSFWLQTCTRCLRGLLQGLINGFFLHRHPLQLPLLIFLDLIFVYIILKFRKCFIHVALFIFTLMYFLLFLFLDSFLLYYSIRSTHEDKQQLTNDVILNFTSVICVLSLLAVAVLKTLFFVSMALYDLIKNLCKKQKQKKLKIDQEGVENSKNIQLAKPNVFVCKNLSNEQLKILQAKKPNRRSKQMFLKINNISNIVEQPLSAMGLKKKKNEKVKKISNFGNHVFDGSKSKELLEVIHHQIVQKTTEDYL